MRSAADLHALKIYFSVGSAFLWDLPFCGSWLACDADTSVHQVHRFDAIAAVRRFDEPAPTFDRVWLCCCCCSGPYILFNDEVSGLLICAFDRDLDLKSPRQTRWPESDSDLRACRAIARHRVLGRGPFGYFCVLAKVTRRQGGIIGCRYLNNGYARHPTAHPPGQPAR